jgi:hypothetical protein
MWSWDGLQLEVKKWATNGYYKETAICLEMLQVVFSLTWCSRNTEHLFMFRPSGHLCIFSPYTINRGHFRKMKTKKYHTVGTKHGGVKLVLLAATSPH